MSGTSIVPGAGFGRSLDRVSKAIEQIKYLSWPDVQSLLQAASGHTNTEKRDHLLLRIMAEAGPRCSEALMLRADSLDRSGPDPYLRIPTEKRHRNAGRGRPRKDGIKDFPLRSVPVRGDLVLELGLYIHDQGIDSKSPLFDLTRTAVYRAVRKYAVAAKVDDPERGLSVHPHTLRHSFGVWMMQNGVPLTTLQDWMGHRSLLSTMVYAKLAQKDSRVYFDRIQWDVSTSISRSY